MVYLILKEWNFRHGQPDDYVTISTNYSLPVIKSDLPCHWISLNKKFC